jgi:hypothetical protein
MIQCFQPAVLAETALTIPTARVWRMDGAGSDEQFAAGTYYRWAKAFQRRWMHLCLVSVGTVSREGLVGEGFPIDGSTGLLFRETPPRWPISPANLSLPFQTCYLRSTMTAGRRNRTIS